jgi:hypothetical protein
MTSTLFPTAFRVLKGEGMDTLPYHLINSRITERCSELLCLNLFNCFKIC